MPNRKAQEPNHAARKDGDEGEHPFGPNKMTMPSKSIFLERLPVVLQSPFVAHLTSRLPLP